MSSSRPSTVRVRETLESVSDPVILLDAPGDRVVDCNEAGSWFLGYEPNELPGTALSRVHPDDLTEIRRVAARVRRETTRTTVDTVCRRKTGETIATDVSLLPVREPEITDSDTTDLTFAVIHRQTEVSLRTRQLAGLLRILRHNVRNRLNVVLGRLDLLARRDGTAPGDDHVLAATAACDDLLDLTENIWSARTVLTETPPLGDPIDAVSLVQTCVRRVCEDTDCGSIRVDSPDQQPVLAGQPLALAVEHTVENALVHNENPTVRAVVSGPEDLDEDCVEIQVADDGSGIPAAERRVADRDLPPTPVAHSSGLGLWLTAWIVRRYRGQIDIDTGTDGTVVSLRLPAPEL
jgi:PAS domain S-box-containing protein